jgi:RES domain-containing protein
VANLSGLSIVARSRLVATGYRHQAPDFDPRSGEGARRQGGRFNPPESFPVIYLCTTPACVRAELSYSAARQGLEVEALLPRELWAVQLQLDEVLDLTDHRTLEQLDIKPDELVRPSHEFTQQLGEAAHELRFQGIRALSATGIDEVIAVFLENLRLARLETNLLSRWATESDVQDGIVD